MLQTDIQTDGRSFIMCDVGSSVLTVGSFQNEGTSLDA